MPDWLKVYHRLPYPAKVLAASARGRYLDRWRYGNETESLVAEYLDRDTWSRERWQTWKEERLAFVLHRAVNQVPYYRDYWEMRRRGGDRASWELLENWPVLAKEELRQSPRAFLAEDCDPRAMYYEHTSGTTGKPLHLWLSKQTLQSWFAMFEARAKRWYGVSRDDRWAILGGQLVAPVERQRPPFWVWNSSLNQLYLSAYHLAPENIPTYAEAIRRHNLTYIMGYPSGLYRLAQEILTQGLEMPALKVAIGNAEPLLDHQRNVIAKAFNCPARETYGMAEIAAAASDCEADSLHSWPDTGVIEVLADGVDVSVPNGMPGRLIATGLINVDMPLIRYETGDRVSLATKKCDCGRTLPVLTAIEGRTDDVVITRDGRYIGRLDPVFKADLPFKEAQIIQEELDLLRVLYVPTPAYTSRDGAALVERIQDRTGPDMRVILEPVAEIPRSANGKFRAVVSRIYRIGAGSASNESSDQNHHE